MNSAPTSWQDLRTTMGEKAFAIARSAIPDERLPEVLGQISRMAAMGASCREACQALALLFADLPSGRRGES